MNAEVYDEKSCGIVLFREVEGARLYLLLHYPSGHWDLPKGHVENGESEHQTAIRELEEETGIADVQIFDNYREPISYRYYKKGRPSHKQVVFFLGKTNEEDVKISHEHQDHLWLDAESAIKKLTFENAQSLVRKGEQVLSS